MEFFDSPYKTQVLDDTTGSFLENYIELNITCDENASITVKRYEGGVVVDTIDVGEVTSGNCVVNLPCFGEWEVNGELTSEQSTVTESETVFVSEVREYFVDISSGADIGGSTTTNSFITNLVTISPTQVLYSHYDYVNSTGYWYYVGNSIYNIISSDSNGLILSFDSNISTNNLWPSSFKYSNYYHSGNNIFYECMSEDGSTKLDSVYGGVDPRSPGILTFSSIAHRWINVINGLHDRSLNITMILNDVGNVLNKYALYSEAYEVSGSNIEAVAYAGLFQPGDFYFYSNNNNQNTIQTYPTADQTTKKLSNLRRTLYTSNKRIIDFSFVSIGNVVGKLDAYDVWSTSASANRNWTHVGALTIQSNTSYGDLTGSQLIAALKDGYLVYCGNKILLINISDAGASGLRCTIYKLIITNPSNNTLALTSNTLGTIILDPTFRFGDNMVLGMNDGKLVIVSGLNYWNFTAPGADGFWGQAKFTSIDVSSASIQQSDVVEQKYFYELFGYQGGYFTNSYADYQLELQCCAYLGSNTFMISDAGAISSNSTSPTSSLSTDIKTIVYNNGHFLSS